MSGSTDILKDFEVKNCRVCFDINDWKKKAQRQAFQDEKRAGNIAAGTALAGSIVFATEAAEQKTEEVVPPEYKQCPPDSSELGRSTWTFLHTMSVYYPDRPTTQQQSEMSQFLHLFSKFYPCNVCASHLREEMQKMPPVVDSRSGLARWMCKMHNGINEMLGKPLFDCEKVDERWRDGPSDSSC